MSDGLLPRAKIPRPAFVPVADDRIRGIGLIVAGFALVACADAAVKWSLPEVGVAAAMIWRGAIGAIAVAVVAGFRNIVPRNGRLITARSLLHTAVTLAFYGAWAAGLPLADSYAVVAVAPLLMTLMAVPMLGETFGWRRTLSTLVGFCGVLVMLRPGGDLWRWEAGMLAAGVAALALTRIWTRQLARTDAPETIAFWLMAAHVPVGFLLLPVFPAPSLLPSWPVVAALVFLGIGNGLAHTLFARAFSLAPVGILAPYEYTTLVWGGILGFLIWHEVPAWATLAGAAVVIAAGLYNLHREQVRARQKRAA
ncbi:DMT family transporter [Humitalea sp. 24SJ18S-53]|uniref:DMT family transporter n=1 Tax=Humitalea sp. 24SJ18S-53 TaxID=3422307 RepID=UPI003D66F1E2